MRITWSKEQRDRSKADDTGLFAAGCDNKNGKYTVHGLMSHEMCSQLFWFCHTLYTTRDPAAAFKKVWPDIEIPKTDA